jgi:hypothetical protein
MPGHGDRLPPKLGRAVHLYLQELHPSAAACQLGISRTTWWRWRHRPEFRLALAIELNRRRALAA